MNDSNKESIGLRQSEPNSSLTQWRLVRVVFLPGLFVDHGRRFLQRTPNSPGDENGLALWMLDGYW
jgi:hypothetical protein